MVRRETAPPGAPCWADLWTSDTDGACRFYGELFGWEAEDPNPSFGGYFRFLRDGVPVAGCMGPMGDRPPANAWKPYIATDDVAETAARAASAGARELLGPHPVADLGVQLVIVDPGRGTVGAWQAGTFPGFTVLDEHGSPSWFELHSSDHATALDFYRSVFGWGYTTVSDTDEFRYTTFHPGSGGTEFGGIMDGRRWRTPDTPDVWDVYWEVDDCRAAVARAAALGGSVLREATDSPYGVIGHVTDPAGAPIKLRTGP